MYLLQMLHIMSSLLLHFQIIAFCGSCKENDTLPNPNPNPNVLERENIKMLAEDMLSF